LAREAIEYLRRGELVPRPGEYGEWTSALEHHENWVKKAKKITPEFLEKMAYAIKNDPALKDLIEEEEDDGTQVNEKQFELPEQVKIPATFKLEDHEAYRIAQMYVEHSKKVSKEGYEDFHPASFLFLLSSIAARRIYLHMANKKLYTNLRIVLCAGSTDYAKSTTASVAITMMRESLGLDHLLIRTKEVTPEKLISNMLGRKISVEEWDAMRQDETHDEKESYRRERAWSAQKSMYWDEYGHVLKNMSKEHSNTSGYIQFLLQIDDCSEPIGKDTQARKEEYVEKPYLPMLCSIVPRNLKSIAKTGSDFWGDGQSGRNNYACAPDNTYIDDCADLERIPAPPELVKILRQWHESLGFPEVDVRVKERQNDDSKKGEPKIDEIMEVEFINPLPEYLCKVDRAAYEQYKAYRSALKVISHAEWFPVDLRTNYGRLSTLHLRIAILFASVENRNGNPKETTISLDHMYLAQYFVEIFRSGVLKFYQQATGFKTAKSQEESEIVTLLRTASKQAKQSDNEKQAWLSVAQIRRRLHEKYSTEEISKALKPLEGTVVVWEPAKRADSAGSYRIKD
jgi:hypothetical protein